MVSRRKKKEEKEGFNLLSPGNVAKASALYWWLYSAYKGVQDLYSKKGKKKSKLIAILSIIFPILLLWIFYGPSKEKE